MITNFLQRMLAAVLPAAHAHCDTAEGPAVMDGRRALESGELGYALKWIPASAEDELRTVYEQVRRVRGLNAEVAVVADRLFLETLVRLHRLAEGVGFTGIQGPGAHVDRVVVAADLALETGDLDPVLALVPAERHQELTRRFAAARALRGFLPSDVAAGRAYIAAYVDFFKYAEGEDTHGRHAHHAHA